MLAILRRELHALLTSAMGYVLLACFAAAMALLGLFVMPRVIGLGPDWFSAKQLTMTSFFAAYPWAAAVVLPAISMRAWAEEARAGTSQLLLTLPLPAWKIVLGKYCAALVFLLLMLVGTLGYVVMAVSEAANVGGIETGPMLGGYAGCFLLGAAFLAIGMFVSAWTRNQMVAYLAALLLCGAMVAWGAFAGLAGAGGVLEAVAYLSVAVHFRALSAGMLRLDTLVYFSSLAICFLTLTSLTIEGHRYRS